MEFGAAALVAHIDLHHRGEVLDGRAHRLEQDSSGRLGADGVAEPAGPVAGLREDHRLLGAEVAVEGRGVDIGANPRCRSR